MSFHILCFFSFLLILMNTRDYDRARLVAGSLLLNPQYQYFFEKYAYFVRTRRFSLFGFPRLGALYPLLEWSAKAFEVYAGNAIKSFHPRLNIQSCVVFLLFFFASDGRSFPNAQLCVIVNKDEGCALGYPNVLWKLPSTISAPTHANLYIITTRYSRTKCNQDECHAVLAHCLFLDARSL